MGTNTIKFKWRCGDCGSLINTEKFVTKSDLRKLVERMRNQSEIAMHPAPLRYWSEQIEKLLKGGE